MGLETFPVFKDNAEKSRFVIPNAVRNLE